MTRWVTFCVVLLLLMAVPSASLFAQLNSNDPRTRRANRENAVAKIGPYARDFVETYGDEAVAAINACSPSVGLRLARFHNSGDLAKFPRPRDLLRVIANPRHRDDVALWAMKYAVELTDTDSFDAYLKNPLEYALGLKQLKTGAAEARAVRLNPTETTTPGGTTKLSATLDSLTSDDRVGITACVCLVILTGIGLWRRKQLTSC